MKNYILSYALLIMTSTAFVQAVQENIVIRVNNATKSQIIFQLCTIINGKIARAEGKLAEQYVLNKGASSGDLSFYPSVLSPKTILIAAKNFPNLNDATTENRSLMSLRVNRNIEFKVIPECTGKLVCTVSEGRISKLKITFDKTDANCAPTIKRKNKKTIKE